MLLPVFLDVDAAFEPYTTQSQPHILSLCRRLYVSVPHDHSSRVR